MGLVVVFILRLAVVGMVMVVVVTVILAEGNRPHRFTGLLDFGWVKPTHIQLSDLGSPFFLLVLSGSLGKGAFL